jgi:hypothetical protein
MVILPRPIHQRRMSNHSTVLLNTGPLNIVCTLVKDSNCFLCDPQPQMFLMPTLVTMSIAATWMYRSLSDFLCSADVYVVPSRLITLLTSCGQYHSSVDSVRPPRIGPAIQNSNSTLTVPAPPTQVELVVQTAHEKYIPQ